MPNTKLTQETIEKINSLMVDNNCTNWERDENDPRYITYICSCGNQGRHLKQGIFRPTWKGCAECSTKSISDDVLNKINDVFEKFGYELINVEKGRKVNYKCEHNSFSTYSTNILKENWKGSCSFCKFHQQEVVVPIVEEIEEVKEIILDKGEWYGGKVCGSILETNTSFKVQFKSPETQTKSFNKNQYGDERARQIAGKYRIAESKRAGLTKNCIRDVTVVSHPKLPEGYTYKEVMLKNDNFTMIENDCLELIMLNNINLFIPKDRKTSYADIYSNIHKKRLHSVLYPEFSEVDHIDRNGLNNLRYNVRDGGGRINSTNRSKQKNNTSGVKGIAFEDGPKPRWKAQWVDKETGKRKTKSFSINKYGDTNAKQLAINCRIENAPTVEDLL